MAMSESYKQLLLAEDGNFLQRVQYLMAQQARVVLTETGIGPTHTARAAYASQVLNVPDQTTRAAAKVLVGGVNLIGTVTVDDQGDYPRRVFTSAIDAAIMSQIATFWNGLAGIDEGN